MPSTEDKEEIPIPAKCSLHRSTQLYCSDCKKNSENYETRKCDCGQKWSTIRT